MCYFAKLAISLHQRYKNNNFLATFDNFAKNNHKMCKNVYVVHKPGVKTVELNLWNIIIHVFIQTFKKTFISKNYKQTKSKIQQFIKQKSDFYNTFFE